MVHHNSFVVALLFALCVISALSADADPPKKKNGIVVSRKRHSKTFKFKLIDLLKPYEMDANSVIGVTASFQNKVNSSGWATQSIATSRHIPDVYQAYWAGYLETYQSLDMSQAHYHNTLKDLCKHKDECKKLEEFLQTNMKYALHNSHIQRRASKFWNQVHLILWQLIGSSDAYDGVFHHTSHQLHDKYVDKMVDKVMSIYLMSAMGDLEELVTAVYGKDDRKVEILRNTRPSCSALIKILPDTKDVFAAHDAWTTYASMLRVAKHYDFPWKEMETPDSEIIPGRVMKFSSYPSVLHSIDDYYLIGSGLVSIETTNGNNNDALWEVIRKSVDSSVLEFFRVLVANRLAKSGIDWMANFKRENSGTYNNQWMILDTKLIEKGQPIPDENVLWIAEQLPGLIVKQDLTGVFKKQGYWSSFNAPYFKEIQDKGGFTALEEKYGDLYSHDNCPRAKIFRRDQKEVQSLKDMYQIMRYNEFQTDPFSKCNCTPPYSAELSIAARCDLNPIDGKYPLAYLGHRLHGAIDMKMADLQRMKSLRFIGTSGPTRETQPPFRWSTLPDKVETPMMHPDLWDFPPVEFSSSANGEDMDITVVPGLSRHPY